MLEQENLVRQQQEEEEEQLRRQQQQQQQAKLAPWAKKTQSEAASNGSGQNREGLSLMEIQRMEEERLREEQVFVFGINNMCHGDNSRTFYRSVKSNCESNTPGNFKLSASTRSV